MERIDSDDPRHIRVATWNIHKGVRGLGLARRLEIHDIGQAVEQFDADVVCLQEVRRIHHRGAEHFGNWPAQPQADYLAPPGYHALYRTNAFTRHGEHGNALLTRWPVVDHAHQDISDHRFEQRGLLHGVIEVRGQRLHVIVVHFGLFPGSRVRQVTQLRRFIEHQVPRDEPVVAAGDFNGWRPHFGQILGLAGLRAHPGLAPATFPARLPMVQLDHVFGRGLEPLTQTVPRGRVWARMSDHLPLLADFRLAA